VTLEPLGESLELLEVQTPKGVFSIVERSSRGVDVYFGKNLVPTIAVPFKRQRRLGAEITLTSRALQTPANRSACHPPFTNGLSFRHERSNATIAIVAILLAFVLG
jgi:hypothetical protein